MSSTSALISPLPPLLPILDAFIHRHSNQHGHSHWFPYVPILRRHLRSLVAHAHRTSVKPPTKPRPTGQDSRIVRDATWFRAKVLPQCFLRFSQLAADNQHAPLGLLLLSLLARVKSVLDKIAPPPPPSPPAATIPHTEVEAPLHKLNGQGESASPKTAAQPLGSEAQRDRGTVISREQLPVPSKKKQRAYPAIKDTLPQRSVSEAKPLKISTPSEHVSKKRKGDESSKADREKKTKTKKKKDKGGDAFSDMFGGL
ncbi:hypothetical protein LIA77_09540 [Sarocladium implicatum]|nr:hypothetical protein LIA77_09540 [Sarocladium implicatum]